MNKKLVLWFILVLALSYGVFQSINPFINPFIKQLFQADIRDEVKNPMNQLMDDLDRQVNKRETMSKKEIESINTDIEKISPNNEEESLYLELTKLILDFKAVDDADAAKLTIANNINYIDDAFTDETYKNLVLIKKYISSFEKRKKAIIEYNQAYLTNVERTLNKAEAKLPRKTLGNGSVVWIDNGKGQNSVKEGTIQLVVKDVQPQQVNSNPVKLNDDGLPF